MCENLFLDTHTMSIRFDLETGCDIGLIITPSICIDSGAPDDDEDLS
jgi:hypothetical protein